MSAPIPKKAYPSHGLTAESRIVAILEAFERQLVRTLIGLAEAHLPFNEDCVE